MNVRSRWLLAAALVPLFYLPLRAAESPPADAAESDEPVPLPDSAAAPQAADEAGEESTTPPRAAAADEDAERLPEETLSLDNNLSFPVDI